MGGAELAPSAVIEEIASHDASLVRRSEACGCTMTAPLDPSAARRDLRRRAPHRRLARRTLPRRRGPCREVIGFPAPEGLCQRQPSCKPRRPHVAVHGKAHRCCAPMGVYRTLSPPKASATTTEIWQVIGLRGTGSDRYAAVDDPFVPDTHFSARPRSDTARTPYAFSSSNHQVCRRGARELARRRFLMRSSNSARDKTARRTPCATTMWCRRKLRTIRGAAGCVTRVFAGERSTKSGRGFSSLSERLSLDHDATRIRLASTSAIDQARHVVDTLYAAGATAIFEANPFERRFAISTP